MSTPQPPAVSTAAARAYGFLPDPLVAHDPAGDFPLLALVAALAAGTDEVYAFAEDPGAGVYLDPRTAPPRWLRWLGLPVGVRVDPRVSDAFPDPALVAAARWEITEAPYMDRGSEAYLRAKLAPLLMPDARLRVFPFTSPNVAGRRSHELTMIVSIDDVLERWVQGDRAASNLVPNPVLSTGTAGWTGHSAVLASSSGWAGTGTHSLRVQAGSLANPHAWTPIGIHPPGTDLAGAAQVTLPADAPGPARVELRLELGGLWPATIATSSVVLVPGKSVPLQVLGVAPPSPAWDELVLDYPTWQDVVDEYPTWQDLVDGFPVWADLADVSARLVLGAPTSPTTGAPLTGQAVYWADPQANVGPSLDGYTDGTRPGASWTGTPHLSASSRPDTRHSDELVRRFKANLPAGLLGHALYGRSATWLRATQTYDTWAAAVAAHPTWTSLIAALTED